MSGVLRVLGKLPLSRLVFSGPGGTPRDFVKLSAGIYSRVLKKVPGVYLKFVTESKALD